METTQLMCMIECDPVLNQRVIGVFAADRLPVNCPRPPFAFIANTDIHTRSGQHWCAFFSDTRGHIDFLDTYGRTPNQNSHQFQRWLASNANTVHTSQRQLQSNNSTVCGLYCILFLHQRLNGYTYQDFINLFDDSALQSNDKFVADTILNAYNQCIGNQHSHNQICCPLHKICII
jgi:hypothetical protein